MPPIHSGPSVAGWIDSPEVLDSAADAAIRRSSANGEALDFWRVVGFEQDHQLSLRAEMRLPGAAVLEFSIEPRGDGKCVLRQTALFQHRGLAGLVYWYAVLPFHHLVFPG